MIGRLVISNRNIYKIKSGSKQVMARKSNILSESHDDILIKTSKEFNPKDEYVRLNPITKTIVEGLGSVGTEQTDIDIYYHLFTNNWTSKKKYSDMWDNYMDVNFDILKSKRIEYKNQVTTIDPINSIDLDDGFSFHYDEFYWYLDIHIVDIVSWFDIHNPKFSCIFEELKKRLQSCYINLSKLSDKESEKNPTHLLPLKIVQLVSFLEIKPDSEIKSRRAVSFCFKISKQSNIIENFKLVHTNLSNIKNYSYDTYDKFINLSSNIELKTEYINLNVVLVKIIGLRNYNIDEINLSNNISHQMIEIFMILTNWYGGNYLLHTLKSYPILRVQHLLDLENFNINLVPKYAQVFLSKSANYILSEDLDNENLSSANFVHNSLGISNYAHISSPMRRFVDMINHFKFYNIKMNKYFNSEELKIANSVIKNQKKIYNGWKLLKFLKSFPESNKFKGCLFDWTQIESENLKINKIIGLLVLYHEQDNFICMVNVELPQIEFTKVLKKYMEFDVELYYNSNNYKSNKFPFSIKII